MGTKLMDDALRNPAEGQHVSAADAANDPVFTADRFPVVRYCSWCKEICVRPTVIRAQDALIVYVYGTDRRVLWNGRELIIQDGICERCREKNFPETTPSRAQTAQPQKEEKQP